uniref:Glycoside hydrolase family 43 protein n=1 Tax=Roseihalotalea indica TaxID=2867963 RepID=A0AA49GN97_9BACT|nr:glycoside hydrolase family 43 protein [Tunicatimonas sp. TK19036]
MTTSTLSLAQVVNDANNLFTNPLLEKGQDPWVMQDGQYYYYCFSAKGAIGVQKVKQLTDIRSADTLVVWTPPANTMYSKELWAPELHKINNRWYVYVAADDGQNKNHRMHVLASKGLTIESGFEYAGQLKDPDDKWAIDGTVLQYQDKMYFVWSGWGGDENVAQNLYIAPMESPTKISGKRVLLSSPEYEWEKRGSGDGLPTINEGPQILQKNGRYHIIYSAAGSWSNDYCLGMLSLTGNDPLNASSWKKETQPVFSGTECVISPGHCSFTTIGPQDWIVYHVTGYPNGGWGSRYVKMQPFYWVENRPIFGKPAEDGVIFPVRYE